MSIIGTHRRLGKSGTGLTLASVLSVLLCLPCLSAPPEQNEYKGPGYSSRLEPASQRNWKEGHAKQLLEEGYIRLGLLTVQKERSKASKNEIRSITFKEAAAIGGDLAVIAHDANQYGYGNKTGVSIGWDTHDRRYRNVHQRATSNSFTPLKESTWLWDMTVEVWRREPELAARELAMNKDFYGLGYKHGYYYKTKKLLKAVKRRYASGVKESLKSGADPRSFKDYAYAHLDYWNQDSLMTLDLEKQASREIFMLLVKAQGKRGWDPDVMEHFFDEGDLWQMLIAVAKTDYSCVFFALTDSGFNGEYLSRQPKVWYRLRLFIREAAYRDGRVIEELLSMPSWRPLFEAMSGTEYDVIEPLLYKHYVFKEKNERMLRLLLDNGYTMDLAKAKEWGATPETLEAMRAAGAH
jgi:hypothetical protein